MRKFSPKMEVLILLLVWYFAHDMQAARSKRPKDIVVGSSEGAEKCITKDGEKQGVCIEIMKCDEATKILKYNPTREQIRFLQQRTCKFEGNNPFFCCASGSPTNTQPLPLDQPPTSAPASRQLTESDLNKICGVSEPIGIRVVGAASATLGEWPWMAAIFVVQSLNFVSCGGVLISEQYVLTASHCFFDVKGQKKTISEYTIRLGELNINDQNDGATPLDLSATEVITHEDYFHTSTTLKNDIALIKLNQSVSFTKLITPICLPSSPPMSNDLYVGQRPYVAGWGTVAFDGKSSSQLLQVGLTVSANDDCQTAYTKLKATIANTQLCAGFHLGGKSACRGDSGGPLMLANADYKWFAIGIVSISFQCARQDFPGIYTRTTSYIDWIKKNAQIN